MLHQSRLVSSGLGARAALRPPISAHVAVVEFEDLECPACARLNSVIQDVTKRYQIPCVRHDFPLRDHLWSFQAAVDARWFDLHSNQLGNEFRDEIFRNQTQIESQADLYRFAVQFSKRFNVDFPTSVDPRGMLSAGVRADIMLGTRLGVNHTPTVWIVSDRGTTRHSVEMDSEAQISQMVYEELRSITSAKNATHLN